jgi:hypothetical protein
MKRMTKYILVILSAGLVMPASAASQTAPAAFATPGGATMPSGSEWVRSGCSGSRSLQDRG